MARSLPIRLVDFLYLGLGQLASPNPHVCNPRTPSSIIPVRKILAWSPADRGESNLHRKNFSIAHVLVCFTEVANLRDPTVRAVRTLSVRLQVPLRGVQTVSTLLSRPVHPREARSRNDRQSKSERVHHRALIPDMYPRNCGSFVSSARVPRVRRVRGW